MKACKGPKKLKACTKQMHEDTQIRKERKAHKFSILALIENSCEQVIIHKNTKTLSKKWYETKNDIDSSIILITSNKRYNSLVCRIHKIFTQTETNFNE